MAKLFPRVMSLRLVGFHYISSSKSKGSLGNTIMQHSEYLVMLRDHIIFLPSLLDCVSDINQDTMGISGFKVILYHLDMEAESINASNRLSNNMYLITMSVNFLIQIPAVPAGSH